MVRCSPPTPLEKRPTLRAWGYCMNVGRTAGACPGPQPITTGGSFARTAGFAVPLIGAGTKTTGVVRCDQPRSLDLRARGAKKLETVPDRIIDEVLSKMGPLLE